MSAERRRQAFEIFDEVCDLPEGERALGERCAGDDELRALVERMLAQDESSPDGGAFGVGVGAEHLASGVGADSPERIGRYRILREIGRGGMGVVYEAEQDDPKRRVALKVIRDGLASGEIHRRFRRESSLLGQLQHPGIAHVYEAGTDRVGGRRLPFFAMELIEGNALNEHIRDEALGTREVLELFARICDAVQHAHQKGVIHRDLKPQNVLVKGESTTMTGAGASGTATIADSIGQPKILDFGVARIADSDANATMQTHAGQLVGTLAYMSPEQLEGDPSKVDTRCDVYAVGVMLYQALAGRLPVEVSGKPIAEAARLIRDTPVRSLGSIDRTLRGDIETIVATAMEHDRERRYASASMLADDIRRYLRDDPISAHPPSTLYQIKKFTARNRLLVGGTAAVVSLLVAGLVATSVLLVKVERERRASDEAEARTRQVGDFQSELLMSMRADEIGRRIEQTLLEELERSTPTTRGDDDGAELDHERVALAIERVNETNLGRAVLKQFLVERAIELVDKRYLEDPRTEAEIRWALMENFIQMGEDEAVVAQARRIVEIRDGLYGPNAKSTLAAKRHLGAALARTGAYDEAEVVLKDVIEAEDRIRGVQSGRGIFARVFLGRVYRETGRHERAEEVLLEAVGSARANGVTAQLTNALNELGVLYLDTGRTDEAIDCFEEYLAIAETVSGPESRRRMLALNNVTAAKLREGLLEEAERFAREAVPLFSSEFGDSHQRTMAARNNLARIMLEADKPAEAASILDAEYERSQRLLTPSNQVRQAIATNAIDAQLSLGNAARAVLIARDLLSQRRGADAPNPGSIAQTLEQLGECQLDLGQNEQAEASFRECLELRESIDADHWLTHRARTHLGVALLEIGRIAEAKVLLSEGVAGITRREVEIPSNMRQRELLRARARLEKLE